MPVLLLPILLVIVLWSLSASVTLRQRCYQTFRLNPEIDWSQPAVKTAWRNYGGALGRFLSEDVPLTMAELLVLGKAHEVQHGVSGREPISAITVAHDLQELFEKNIVLVGAWRPFPTSSAPHNLLWVRNRQETT